LAEPRKVDADGAPAVTRERASETRESRRLETERRHRHHRITCAPFSPMRLAALAAERMTKDGGGSIINVSSVGAVQPTVGELPYAMAKSALHTMAAAMAHDYAGKVRVNVIMPGAFLTDISKAWPAEMRAMMERQIPMGRCGEPDEVVGAALYLASDASSYTSVSF
jgi:NAD(P)-dependent dehydrogenase (short-subunit alcohol dehydrogenase family)